MERIPTDCLESTRNSLQAVKDAMLESKYLTHNIVQQQKESREEVDRIKHTLKTIETSIIRNDERIAVLYNNHQGMLTSVRTIQNAVIAALVVSILSGIGGLAFNSFKQSTNTLQGISK